MKKHTVRSIILVLFVNFVCIEKSFADFDGGDGLTTETAFQVSTLAQLQDMGSSLSFHYILMDDIDATSTTLWNDNGTTILGFVPIARAFMT